MSVAEVHDDPAEWERRAGLAQAAAAQAYARLLRLAETGDSGQVRRVAQFIASTYDGATFPFDLFELRTVDVAIADDMLVCLDALRWSKADLYKLVPDGGRRVLAICTAWGLVWPDADAVQEPGLVKPKGRDFC